MKVIKKVLDYRESEKKKLEQNENCFLGDVSTVNLTKLEVRGHIKIYKFYPILFLCSTWIK